MKRALAITAVIVAAMLAQARAAGLYSSPTIDGNIVDAHTGAPVAGAVIVARWEWLEYSPKLHGEQYGNAGHPLHVAEAITDGRGRYHIDAWGPKPAGNGHPDNHLDPMLAVFKAGYEPRVLRNEAWTDYVRDNPAMTRGSEWNGKSIALTPWRATPKEYAERIARMQDGYPDGGLLWRAPPTDPRWMPRMVEALHREKRRLGADGAAILGVNDMPGRSGAGLVVDAATGASLDHAVVAIAWTLRRTDGHGTRTFVEQRSGSALNEAGRFYVSPWRVPGPKLPGGWEIATNAKPLVSVYAKGYERLAGIEWEEQGGTVRLKKLGDGADAMLAQLRLWRHDVDATLAAAADRDEGLESSRELARAIVFECRTLVPDARAGICFEPGSDVVRYVEDWQKRGIFTVETSQGPREMKIVVASPGIQAHAAVPGMSAATATAGVAAIGARASAPLMASMPRPFPGPVSVRGFSIEPVATRPR